ncbi:hypothetical protein K9N50_02590 [bacterium]|nr:hypothetical protein [bacterium]
MKNLFPKVLFTFVCLTLIIGCTESKVTEPVSIDTGEIQATVGAIYNAIKMHRQDNHYDPETVEQLEDGEYIELNEEIKNDWEFYLVKREHIERISAYSKPSIDANYTYIIELIIETGVFVKYRSMKFE